MNQMSYLADLKQHTPGRAVDKSNIDSLAARYRAERSFYLAFFAGAAISVIVATILVSFGYSPLGAYLAGIVTAFLYAWAVTTNHADGADAKLPDVPEGLRYASPEEKAIYSLGSAKLSEAELQELKDWAGRDPDASAVFARWMSTAGISIYEHDARMLRRYLYTLPNPRAMQADDHVGGSRA